MKSVLLSLLVVLNFTNVFANDTETIPMADNVPDNISKTPDMNAPDPEAVQPPKGKIPNGLVALGSGQYFSDKAIVVDKKRRTLTLWSQEVPGEFKLIKAYPVDYGRKDGDKFKLGDLKTPEGVYFFETTYFGDKLNYNEYGKRAFTMNYPNYWDKKEKKTGSGIWLHAIPETKTLQRGSRGCIVVRNEAIEELKHYISLKRMPIIVKETVDYVEPRSNISTKKEVLTWLNKWITDWESLNIDQYISHYGNDFKGLRMNLNQWKKYKERVNKKYTSVNVEINEPIVLIDNNEITVRFLQDYQSDKHADFGEKTLFIKSVDGEYKIVHEKWKPIPKDVVAAFKQAKKRGSVAEPL